MVLDVHVYSPFWKLKTLYALPNYINTCKLKRKGEGFETYLIHLHHMITNNKQYS